MCGSDIAILHVVISEEFSAPPSLNRGFPKLFRAVFFRHFNSVRTIILLFAGDEGGPVDKLGISS